MRITLLDPDAMAIASARAAGDPKGWTYPVARVVAPLPHANCLVIHSSGGNRWGWWGSSFFLDQFSRGWKRRVGCRLNFAASAHFEEIGHHSFIYVDPAWRARRPVYADCISRHVHVLRTLGRPSRFDGHRQSADQIS